MSRLAALYLKLDLEIPIHEQEPSRTYLQNLVKRLSSEIYRQDVKAEVRFRQGSLEVWIMVAGSIYVAIGNYGSFRSGVKQIVEDTKALKNILVSSLRKDGVAEAVILKQRQLAATPERVRRLLTRIDRFEQQLPEFAEEEAKARLRRILKAVQELTYEMEFPEDINLLMTNLDERFHPLYNPEHLSYRKSFDLKKRPTFLDPENSNSSYYAQLPSPDDR
ncbi:hypothetical protein [Pseudomonas sp. 9Ag]|uniref:hypothetical protein n=1 Tax=Pseudomonas sp. 9Ag TaxID=2653167 RepID=UPI0012F26CE9|nr:hypothetical protein [Pseudomonas sp. 9Ag]VXC24978.1 hypothetical protein PSEUDO9AG_10557 [Pseudomonas sp. 9Ag]